MTSPYFRFEKDFTDSLRCIPMAVRLKLDLAGIKLKLSEWAKLAKEERVTLAFAPCGNAQELRTFAEFLSAYVSRACGSAPSAFPVPTETPAWESGDIPAQVREKAEDLDIPLRKGIWETLTVPQRFALVKLSRPGHEGKNFRPALEEFGMTESLAVNA